MIFSISPLKLRWFWK